MGSMRFPSLYPYLFVPDSQNYIGKTNTRALLALLFFFFPLLNYFYSRTTHPQTQGGSIANVISGCINRHPYADRPLLDFSLILMMEPTTIVG